MKTTRQKIVDEARTWDKVRFRHQGRSRNGVDCVGMLIAVSKKVLGVAPDIDNNYSKRPSQQDIFDNIKKYLIRIKKEDARPGDIVQMRYGKQATHFGLLTDAGVIHAAAMNRRVVEHRITPEVRSHIIAYFAIPGVDE